MENAVVTDGLSVTLGTDVRALRNVSVQMPAGKVVGILGPSGSGKTTLIRALVGRQKLADGSATVLGLSVGSAKLRGLCSYMTQGLSVYGDLTVAENLKYFATMAGVKRKQNKSEVTRVLKAVDMTRQADRLVGNLSGGQKQRVSLAVALLGNPQVLFLDEPTVGLDPVLREQLWSLFNTLVVAGKTIILSSHAMDEASRCHHLLLLRDGKVLAQGTPTELCERTGTGSVEASFIKLVGVKA